jgi:hypothetical protein
VTDLEQAALAWARTQEMPASTRRDVKRAELVLRAAARRYWAERRLEEDTKPEAAE